MNTSYKQIREGRATRKSQAGCLTGLAWLLVWCAFTAGCAVVEPPAPRVSAEQTPAVKDQAITRLGDGRTGFVITETPKFLTTWGAGFERAVALMQEDREKEAMPILEEIIRQSPGVTAPYINLAIIYRHAGQYEQAERLVREALKLVPGHPVANNEYGLLLRQTGRFAEAREVYEATLQMFPEYLPVRRNLGILCELYLGDNACAVEQYTIYSKAKPDTEEVALWIAGLNLRMGSN